TGFAGSGTVEAGRGGHFRAVAARATASIVLFDVVAEIVGEAHALRRPGYAVDEARPEMRLPDPAVVSAVHQAGRSRLHDFDIRRAAVRRHVELEHDTPPGIGPAGPRPPIDRAQRGDEVEHLRAAADQL